MFFYIVKKIIGLFIISAFLFGNTLIFAQREPIPNDPNAINKPVAEESEQKKVMKKRNREGTLFQGEKVFFRQTGNRTTLYTTEDNERFVCLENLNLERILKAIEQQPSRAIWKVDGEFTEFRGENYVLIRRAVMIPDGTLLPSSPVNTPASVPANKTRQGTLAK
ncbi:MAG: hypothetical protein LBI18_06560 [Planctomycetaceae bacterium]|jgi:hypothetical protein|nr:hypothetical protein [Planctomycetaceae bacterium]